MSTRTEATRQRLFDAAMELIGQRGAEAVTVDEIAAAAGVAKGTVYYNFGSKNELVAQLLQHGMGMLMAALAPAGRAEPAQHAAHDAGPSPHARTSPERGAVAAPSPADDTFHEVRGMVTRALRFIEAYPGFVRLWMGEQWRGDGTWHTLLAARRAEVLVVIRGALDRVAARREPAPGQDLDVVATALFGAAFMVGMDRVSTTPPKPLAPAAEAITALAIGAFGG
ncbi:helix-turn-helix domain-containing protein [Sinomonas sp. ASV486]|uniref:TetR/AcrR family transcriptional regulator n=1 Tax=Sinomonas puerhi TaxID=3238584 RepID=A0AB39L6I9_9MICC|nr:helix-turn-helix domain-containing protein [Sinomonas sp. ASV486]MDQ4489876.1 helix-turn-helix domain-containing protein [Sinomonas sp. ASV486]